MLMIPKPEPPLVTVSPDVFLSLASPLTGCAKSQKYLNVCFCTRSSSALSETRGNLSDESIEVTSDMLMGVCRVPFFFDCNAVEIDSSYFVRYFKGVEG